MKKVIEDFLCEQEWSFQEESSMALELCEEENDYHMTSYWVQGNYDEVDLFLRKNYTEELGDTILEMYPGDLEKLVTKIKNVYIECSNKRLVFEALSSMLLSALQRYVEWYSVYGSEEDDMIDFKKYHILNALENSDEFPVMKNQDVVAAMLGVNVTVQPSDMYDVFAHYAEELEIPKEETLFEENNQSVFTPDPFLIAGIVGRWKQYTDMTKGSKVCSEYAFKFAEIESYELSDFSKAILYLDYLKEDYLYRFAEAPCGVPINEGMLVDTVIEDGDAYYLEFEYKIRGIEKKQNTWVSFETSRFSLPSSPIELQNIMMTLVTEFRKRVVGMEKEKNGAEAIEGAYPIKRMASHGTNFIKDLNVKFKNNRGITEKKVAKPTFSLALAEKQSLYFIKKSMRYGSVNPILSTSFGIDSTLTHHLIRRVSKTAYNLLHNDSLVEYPDLLVFKREQIKKFNLADRITETKPIKTYWKLKEQNGWNFERKGDRRNGTSNSEECCKYIKHIPAQMHIDKLIEEGNPMTINFSGLRSAESRVRSQQTKRDGIVYYAKSWKTLRVNPIAFFTDDMVWEYVQKHSVEYCKVYDMILYYEDVFDSVSDDEYGKVYYRPRVGCFTCLVTQAALPGAYIKFLKKYYPSIYNLMMFKRGLVKDLFALGATKLGIFSENITVTKPIQKQDAQVSLFDIQIVEETNNVDIESVDSTRSQLSLFDVEEEVIQENTSQQTMEQMLEQYPVDLMEQWIMRRPCKFA